MWSSKIGKEVRGFLIVLPFGFIVSLIYILIEWVGFNYILTIQKRFLLESIVVFADSFLINAIAISMVPVLLVTESKFLSPAKIFKTSFTYLPKIILSYFLLMMVAQTSFEASQSSPIPALIILVLFVWAPYFVALEQYAEQAQKKEAENEDVNNLDPFDDALFIERPRTLFSQKSPWHLGFGRSLEFTSKNASLAISVVFIIWLVRVIPELLIGLTLDTNKSFTAVILQVFATCLGAIFVNLYTINALFRALEPAQRSELMFSFGPEYKDKQAVFMLSSPSGIRVAVLCLLVIFTTVLWSERRIQLGALPQGLSFKVQDLKKTGDEILLKIEMSDEESKFRWFNPNRFRFLTIDPVEEAKEAKKKADQAVVNENSKENSKKENNPEATKNLGEANGLESIMKMLNEKLDNPSRIVVYDSLGKVIEEGQYSPRNEPLKIVLAFPVKNGTSDKAPEIYEVSYLNPFGLKQVMLTFTEEGGAALIGKVIKP